MDEELENSNRFNAIQRENAIMRFERYQALSRRDKAKYRELHTPPVHPDSYVDRKIKQRQLFFLSIFLFIALVFLLK